MNPDVIDGFLLAEVLAGSGRKGLTRELQAQLGEREPDDRVAFVRQLAAKLRPEARPGARASQRIAALLGASGPPPRRRYRPPPGLLAALRRRLAMRPAVTDGHARGAGRSAAAHLEDLRATFEAEDAAAALALTSHLDPPDETEERRLRSIWAALVALEQATVANLGHAALGEGDDALGRGGRELRELEEDGWLA